MSLGVKLRRLRQQKNWSQSEIAQQLDVSQPAYNKWETDQAKPNINNLLKIAEVFEIDIYDLIENAPSTDFSNSSFNGGTNIVANTNPTINIEHTEILESILKNQEQITQLIETQNKFIERLLKSK